MKPAKEEQTKKFISELQDIVDLGASWNISSDVINNEINTILKCNCADGNCSMKLLSQLQTSSNHNSTHRQNSKTFFLNILTFTKLLYNGLSTFFKLLFAIIAVYFVMSCHNPTQKFVMRHSQTLIYPIMRSVRLLTLPLIRRYDSLTEWHEEECLVKNPLYIEPPLDCWPCEGVRTLVDLTGLYNYSKAYCYNERPFLVRDIMTEDVTFTNISTIFYSNRDSLVRGTAKFVSSSAVIDNVSKLWNTTIAEEIPRDTHVVWKLNRVSAARVVRQVFRRPYFVSNKSEVALQRYIFVDGPEAPQYWLPSTDFANVWLAQGQGYRLFVLYPSDPCKLNCTTVSVLLKPRDVVYYNNQYWKPRSLPARLSDELSITYMGSFY